MIGLFLLASISVNCPDKMYGLTEFTFPIEITSTRQDTISVLLTLDNLGLTKGIIIKDVYMLCDSVPEWKRRRISCIDTLTGTWQNWYISHEIDTNQCEEGYYWSEEWGIVKGTLDGNALIDSNHFLKYEKFLSFKSDWIRINDTGSTFDEIIIPNDLSEEERVIANRVIDKYKTMVGTRVDTTIEITDSLTGIGELNGIIVIDGETKLRITFKKALAEIGTAEGGHGLIIKNMLDSVVYSNFWNSWYSTYNYCHWFVCNKDSMTADWTNSVLRLKWLSLVTTPAHYVGKKKTIVDSDNSTELWTCADGDSNVWILKPTFDKDGDSVCLYASTDAGSWQKDSAFKVFDTTNKWTRRWGMNEASGDLVNSTIIPDSGVVSGTMTYSKKGVINTSDSANGAGHFDCEEFTGFVNDFTVSAWIKPNSYSQSGVYSTIVGGQDEGAQPMFWKLSHFPNNNYIYWIRDTIKLTYTYTSADTGSGFHYVVGIYKGTGVPDSMFIYWDGQLKAKRRVISPFGLTPSTTKMSVMTYSDITTERFRGCVDELRITLDNRLPNQIKNEYMNQKYPTTWWTMRAEQSSVVSGNFGSQIIIIQQ